MTSEKRPGDNQQLIGRFIVDSVIGAGGAGRVFKVYDPKTRQVLALKITTVDEDSENSSILPRFRREFSVARGLNHPNLIRVYEFGSMENQLFYTMELIDGHDWSSHLNRFKSNINELEAQDRQKLWLHILDLLIQSAEALMYLHDNGLVHRDIKPGNLLINKEDVLKVTDFGTMRNADSFTQMTKTGSILGTVAYMSPEQTVTSKVDHRSDIYSLGLIAYESFTGQMPFNGPIMKQILTRSRQDVPDPRRQLPELPGSVAEVLNRMVKRRPEDRFSSARELSVQLKAASEILAQINTARLQTQTERPMLKMLETPMIGCDTELHRIYGALQSISSTPTPRFFLIQGGVGMGKTRLTIESRTQAELMGREIYGSPRGKTGFLKLALEIMNRSYEPEVIPDDFSNDLFNWLSEKPGLFILDNIHLQSERDQEAISNFLKHAIQGCLQKKPFPVVVIMTTGDHDECSRETARKIRRIMRNYDEFYHHRLTNFSHEEIRRFVAALLPGPLEIFDLPERLHAVTGGNPFHVEHCIRHLITEGIISHVGAVWVAQMNAGFGYRPLTRAETPVDLIRYSSERLRLLNEDERKVIQMAALFPSRFTENAIRNLIPDQKDSLPDILNSVLQKGIIQTAPGVDEGYMFTTPVLASWALETFSSHSLHMTIDSVRQILDLFPETPTVSCRLAAAQLAQRMKRPDIAMVILMENAEKWYQKGWISPSMTAWKEAMSIQTDTDGTLVLKCCMGIGKCMRDLGHWRSALAHFDELVHHSGRTLKDTHIPNRKLTQIHINSVLELADTMRRLGMTNEAEKRTLDFMTITRQPDLRHLHRKALTIRARIRRDRNDLQFSEAIFNRLLQELDPVEDRVESNLLRLDLAISMWKRGCFNDALSILETALISNSNPSDQMLTCRLKLVIGDTEHAMRNYSNAVKNWSAAAELAEREMFPLERCAALIRIASSGQSQSKEEHLLRVQSILHRLDLEELCLERII